MIQFFEIFVYNVKYKAGADMKLISKCLIAGAGTLAAIAASVIVTDRIEEHKEKTDFIPYGTAVETRFGKMTAVSAGEKGPQIVLLNGYGSPSPYLEFKPLMKELSRFARVTVLEMLGYGCSDNTTRPRTIDHIVEELDAALDALNLSKVWLMPHSISGIYSLAYVNAHPEKVEGLLMIDPSHPEQIDYFNTDQAMKNKKLMKESGILRIIETLTRGKEAEFGKDYDVEDVKLMKKMELWHTHDKVQTDEGMRIRENMNITRNMAFLEDLPVLMMLSSKNVEVFEDWWKPLHEKQLKSTRNGKLVILEGTHFLHQHQSALIAETSRKFIRDTLIQRLEEAEKLLKAK